MAAAWTPLANLTLGSAASSVTFSSISGAYRDLYVVVNGTASVGYTSVALRFNNDSGSNYNDVYMTNNGSSPYSNTNTSQNKLNAGSLGVTSSSSPLTWLLNILDYVATDKHKTVLSRVGTGSDSSIVEAAAGRWASTSAVTSVQVFPVSANWSAGTTFALYGVSA